MDLCAVTGEISYFTVTSNVDPSIRDLHLFYMLHLSIMLSGITLKNGTLIIERVKKDDEGIYECLASNDRGEAKTSAVITVVGEYQLFTCLYFFIHHLYYHNCANCPVLELSLLL